MTTVSPHPRSAHIVQLFDAARSRADAVARFLAAGWETGDELLIIARARYWDLIADHLERCGCPAREADAQTRIHVVDAAAALRRMRKRGVFMREAAQHVVEEVVDAVAACDRPVRAYGEIVDLLAEEGAFDEACQLEHVWNAVLAGRDVQLLCGYSAAHFADSRHAAWLRGICTSHTRVDTHSADSLGTWLTKSLQPSRA